MSDIHVLVGAYSVDAVDDIERASFERHLAGCPACRAEVDSLREAAAALADDVAVAPPAALRSLVLADIARVRPLPPVATAGGPVVRRRWFPALVAAAVIAIVGVGGVVWHPWRDEVAQTVSAADQVLADPQAQRVTHLLPNGAKATIVRSLKLHKAVLVTEGMPPAPDGKIYQIWFQAPDEHMVPAGLMKPGQTTALLDGDADEAIGAGVTVEPAGGSQEPTSAPVVAFAFQEAA